MKIGFLITARLKSTRLPKKIILEINGRQIIRWMIDRLKMCNAIDEIIICTSTNPKDDLLERISLEEGVNCFRGSEDDVILRLYDATKEFNLDYALNVTADCPLVSIEHIEKTVKEYKRSGADFIQAPDLPHGFYCWGLKVGALRKVCEIKNDTNTEVWGKYFTETGLFHVINLATPKKYIRKDFRLTLDYEEDYKFFKKLFSHFGTDTYKKNISDFIEYLDNNPKVVEINKHCKKLYQVRWDAQSSISS